MYVTLNMRVCTVVLDNHTETTPFNVYNFVYSSYAQLQNFPNSHKIESSYQTSMTTRKSAPIPPDINTRCPAIDSYTSTMPDAHMIALDTSVDNNNDVSHLFGGLCMKRKRGVFHTMTATSTSVLVHTDNASQESTMTQHSTKQINCDKRSIQFETNASISSTVQDDGACELVARINALEKELSVAKTHLANYRNGKH
jgi:hypothetical protein